MFRRTNFAIALVTVLLASSLILKTCMANDHDHAVSFSNALKLTEYDVFRPSLCKYENKTIICTLCLNFEHFDKHLRLCAQVTLDPRTQILKICVMRETTEVLMCKIFTLMPRVKLCIPFFQAFGIQICLNLYNIYYDMSRSFGACGLLDISVVKDSPAAGSNAVIAEYIEKRSYSLSCFHSEPLRGIDIVAPYMQNAISVDDAYCLRQRGFEYAALQVFSSDHGILDTTIESVMNLHAAGFRQVDLYHLPLLDNSADPEASAKKQLEYVFDYFKEQGFDWTTTVANYWIDVVGTQKLNPSQWSTNNQTNYVFLKTLTHHLLKFGYLGGIHTGAKLDAAGSNAFSRFIGNTDDFSNHLLWFDMFKRPEESESYQDSDRYLPYPFGGWTHGLIKKHTKNSLEKCPSGSSVLVDIVKCW